MKLQSSFRLATAALAAAVFVWLAGQGMAAEKSAVDPTGTWKILRLAPGTKKQSGSEETLKLKLESGKLTGTITGRSSNNGKVRLFEWPIKDGKVEGSDLSFAVTHPPVTGTGADVTTTYKGQMTGDTIKGKSETDFSGNLFQRDFEAKRVKE